MCTDDEIGRCDAKTFSNQTACSEDRGSFDEDSRVARIDGPMRDGCNTTSNPVFVDTPLV